VSSRTALAILVCAALYLVGNGRVSLWDRDEPRYAQASRQMLQSGDWVVPKLLDQPRINKPPLIYWCQAAAMSVFGDNEAAARLPSSVAMIVTLVLLATVLRRILDEEQTFWTVLIFGTCGLVIMAAKMCLTVAVLLLFVTASQLCLYAMWRGRGTWPVVIAFGVATGLGLLTKGPVVLGVNLMTVGVLGVMRWWDQRSRSEDPAAEAASPRSAGVVVAKLLIATVIALALFVPWVLAVQRSVPGGLEGTVYKDIFQRMTQPLEQHSGPPGYYLISFLGTFAPWLILLPAGLWLAWRDRRTSPLLRFSLAAAIGPWLMFELIRTKLPHYVLPCFPFMAVMTASALVRGIRGEHACFRGRWWMALVAAWAVVIVAIAASPWLALLPGANFDRLPLGPMLLLGLVATTLSLTVVREFARGRVRAAAYAMALTMVAVMSVLFVAYLPAARFLHLSSEVGAFLRQTGATTPGDVVMIDYKEDSLPFYQGGTIRPQRKQTYLASEPPETWPTYLVITREIWEQTPPDRQAHLEVLKTFRGWAYADGGRVVDVMVARKK
jgi:4-amino-4-deoxy-L-arabinose transferase-like glycosyltransferase